MHNKLVLGSVALGAAVLVGGCFGQTGAYAEVDAPVVFAAEPTLVVVEPGIWVVRDYDYSVYYVDDYYWVYRDDVWHRSRTYDGGWATVEVSIVPRLIVSRDQRAYVHYHGGADAPTRSAPRARGNAPDRPQRADDRRAITPDRDRDKGPRAPERADDRHDPPPDRERDKAPRAPERADDRHDPSPDRDRDKNSDKHEDHDKKDAGKGQRQHDNDAQKRGDKRDDHDKR